jgi:hypothetical protein
VRHLVVERFLHGPRPVYERAAREGRMLPEGLTYVESWVGERLDCCFQLMETDDPGLFDDWTAAWDDLAEFEIVPVLSSSEASARALAGPSGPAPTLEP